MELGRGYCRAIGLGVCGLAIGIAAVAPFSDSAASPLDRATNVSSVPDDSTAPDVADGSLAATVSWPREATDLEATDICVVVFDADGGVVRGDTEIVSPIPGQPGAARWTLSGLADGDYTVYVAQCPSPELDTRRWVEPQFLGGGADSDAANWVEIDGGALVDLGPIALHAAGLATWPQRS